MRPLSILLAATVLMIGTSCEKLSTEMSAVSAEIQEIEVFSSNAILSGTITFSGRPGPVQGVVVFYGTAPDSMTKRVVAHREDGSSFNANLDALQTGARYYCRADVLINCRPVKGEVREFEMEGR